MTGAELGAAWLSACASAVTAVIAVVAAIVAYKQLGEARRVREEQAQPFVVVDFEPNPGAGHPFVDLVIRNVGKTLAKNVKVEFTPPLVSTIDGSPGQPCPVADVYMLKHGISSLAPGREHRMLFEKMPDRYERSDLPRQYEVKVQFESTTKAEEPLHQTLDLDVFFGYEMITALNVHHIAKTLRAWAKKNDVHTF